jgi:hypothetical protein
LETLPRTGVGSVESSVAVSLVVLVVPTVADGTEVPGASGV